MNRPSFSVIIPTLNAEAELSNLLSKLCRQEWIPNEILVVDSSSEDRTSEIARSFPLVRFQRIDRLDFNHGGTRDWAFRNTSGDFVLYLTQDALPENDFYTRNILEPFDDPRVALVTGRQIPKRDARRYVQLVQEYNYPETSNTRGLSDLTSMGIKALFCSDTCSAYRRSALQEVGGIPNPCATNEDMLAAARLMKKGWMIRYEARARVVHSHNLTPSEQYRRNRLIGRFLIQYGEELSVASEVGEGLSLVQRVASRLVAEGHPIELMSFGVDCLARLLGNLAGKKDQSFKHGE